jgi:hypothetical protein
VNFILLGRRGGKTTEVLSWFLAGEDGDPYRYLVVMNQETKKDLLWELTGKAGPRDVWDPQNLDQRILTFDQILDGRHRGLRGVFAIDNVDAFLRYVFRQPIELVTATPDHPSFAEWLDGLDPE